jgi:hypothetical protein
MSLKGLATRKRLRLTAVLAFSSSDLRTVFGPIFEPKTFQIRIGNVNHCEVLLMPLMSFHQSGHISYNKSWYYSVPLRLEKATTDADKADNGEAVPCRISSSAVKYPHCTSHFKFPWRDHVNKSERKCSFKKLVPSFR